MAMVICRKCGKSISSYAEQCPFCNEKNDFHESDAQETKKEKKHDKTNKKKKLLFTLIGIVIVGIIIIAISFGILNKSEKNSVKVTVGLISSIGEVDINSEKKIIRAEYSINYLSPKCKMHVKNKNVLKQARKEFDRLVAQDVINEIESITTVTFADKEKIESIRKRFDKLNDNQKKLVTNYSKFLKAEEDLSNACVKKCEELINGIGTISIDSGEAIKEAERFFNTLSKEEQSLINNKELLKTVVDEYQIILVERCISDIDNIGEVSLEKEESIKSIRTLYSDISLENQNEVNNYEKLVEAEKRITELKQQAEERKITLLAGDEIENDNWFVVFKDAKLTTRIIPENTSDYYYYYQCDDDEVFLDLRFSVKNTSTGDNHLNNAVKDVEVTYKDDYRYSNYVTYVSRDYRVDRVYSSDGIEPLKTDIIHIATTLPREAMSGNGTIKVSLSVAGQIKIINVR